MKYSRYSASREKKNPRERISFIPFLLWLRHVNMLSTAFGRAFARRTLPLARQLAKQAGPRSGKQALALPELRLVCEQGKQLGVLPPAEALSISQERKLHLIEVSASATPPVWRLFVEPPAAPEPPPPPPPSNRRGKVKGGKGKGAKEPRVKEVRLTDKCHEHDAQVKIRYAQQFLSKGRVVKVVALNTGKVDEAEKLSRAEVLVKQIIAGCDELGTSGQILGKTSTENAAGSGILGVVTVVITPRGLGHETTA